MSIRIVCPNCRAAYTVADELRGKKARCRECQTLFLIGASAPPAAPAPIQVEVADDEPSLPAVVEIVVRREPPARRSPPPVRRRPVDDVEDEEPRPRRKRKRKESSAGVLIAILLIGGTLFAFCLVVGVGVWLLAFDKDTESKNQAQNSPAVLMPNPFVPGAGGADEEEPLDPAVAAELAKNVPARAPEVVIDPPLQAQSKGAPRPPAPDTQQLAADVVKKVKRATVLLKVAFGDGQKGQGSGFFGVEKGIVVTNAHVLGMLQAGSKQPQKVEVVLNSGEPDETTIAGEFIGVDRSSDLGLLRVDLKEPPPPLEVQSALGLRETQQVWVFGFPFGSSLGKAVTVNTSSVSSLRKDKDTGLLTKVQVHGGMQPGNSGGPVVDAWGDVVGVSVSMVYSTPINFAVPGDYVHVILNGRITDMTLGQPYRDGDHLKVPVTMHLLDPLRRIRNLGMECWSGKPDAKVRPPSLEPPPVRDGDTPKQRLALDYKAGTARGEVILPASLESGNVYWIQPTYSTAGATKWALGQIYAPPALVERQAARLKLQHQEGATRKMTLSQRFTMRVRDAVSDDHAAVTSLESRLTETTKAVDPEGKADIHRQYNSLRLGVKLGEGQPAQPHRFQQLVPYIRGLAANLQVDGQGKVVYSQVESKGETHPYFQNNLTDLHDAHLQPMIQALTVTPPAKQLQPGETWTDTRPLPLEIGVGAKTPGSGEALTLHLTYTYAGLRKKEGKEEAVVTVVGTARTPSDPEGRGLSRVTGTLVVDRATGQTVDGAVFLRVEINLPTMFGQSYLAQATQELRLHQMPPGEDKPAPAKKK